MLPSRLLRRGSLLTLLAAAALGAGCPAWQHQGTGSGGHFAGGAAAPAAADAGATVAEGAPGAPAAPSVPDAAPPPPPEPEPAAWIVTVHGVRVATLRTASSDHWDGAVVEATTSHTGLCGLVGALVGGAAAAGLGGPGLAAGGATVGKSVSEAFCPEARPLARERDPQAPDLVVALTTGEQDAEHVLRTPTARDSYEEDFGYAFLVPTAAIPARGLQLRVQDQDGPADFETLGAAYLTLADLHRGEKEPMLVLADGAVVRLEVTVARAPEVASETIAVNVAGGLQLGAASVPAGTVVELRAAGSYKLAKNRPAVGPKGGGPYKQGNVQEPPFSTAEHGAAIATIGLGQRIEKLLVPGCVRVTTRYAGPILVGVNDTSPADNQGELTFTVTRRVPGAAEWLHPGEHADCPAP